MQKLLSFHPTNRITAAQVLAHPYLATYSDPDAEPNHPTLVDFGFEKTQLIPDIKRLMAEEVRDWKGKQGKADRRTSVPPSPRRAMPPVVEDKIPDIPRFQDTEVPVNGPQDIEEELKRLSI
jgi:hypothetical protein